MNLREAIGDRTYPLFSRMNEDNRRKQIQILEYISNIASATSVNIDSWNILEIFGRTGNTLFLDKKEINRRFWAKHRSELENAPQDRFSVGADIQRMLNESIRERTLNAISTLQRDKDNQLSYIQRVHDEIDRRLREANAIDQEIRILSQRNVDITSQINVILANGNWKFHSFNNNVLSMVTENIQCQHRNENASIDMSVDLGSFKAELDVTTMVLKVREHENNVVYGNYYHPHVSAAGNVCWGESGAHVHTSLTGGEIVEVFSILHSLLNDYCDNNPYIPLFRFYNQQLVSRQSFEEGESQARVQTIIEQIRDENTMFPDNIESLTLNGFSYNVRHNPHCEQLLAEIGGSGNLIEELQEIDYRNGNGDYSL